jgi:hypothetical protein
MIHPFVASVPHATSNLQLPTFNEVCYNLPMTSQQAKVLNGLMERRALEAAFDALRQTTSLADLTGRAQEIASHGSAALPVLIARLDTDDPQLRGGLGLVAQHMEHDLVAPALRAAVRAQRHSDRARVTALTILERYLNERLDEGLLAAIRDPGALALQSLREMITAMEDNPAAIIEYLNQLSQQSPDVPGMLMQALPQLMPDRHLVTLLRMFAQAEDVRLAQQALEQLGRTRSPEAALALVSLTATLPPERASLADRSLRKLRMSGIQAAPAIPISWWRALLSPVDSTGVQTIWFVCSQPGAGHVTALALLTKDVDGIVAAFGGADLPGSDVLPLIPEGEILSVPQPEQRRPLMLLGVPFEVGRGAAGEALKANWGGKDPLPLPYRFLNDMIWQYGTLGASSDVEATASTEPEESQLRLSAALLDHPAFAGWFWQAPALYDAAERLGRKHTLTSRAAAVEELASVSFGGRDAASYQRRLQTMANWLRWAKQEEAARLAQAAAQQLAAGMPAESPFVRRLIGIGLDVAAINLQSGYDLRRET